MILYYKNKESFRNIKVVVKELEERIFNCYDNIPPDSLLCCDSLCKVPLYRVMRFTKVNDYYRHEVIPVDVNGNAVPYKNMKITSSKITGHEKGEIEFEEETDCTPEEAMEILKSVKLPSLENRDKYYPEKLSVFPDSELYKIDKKLYIPKSVYTNISSNNYKYQKNLQLKTIDGIDNMNKYHRVYLTVEIPNENLTLNPNELYNILVNCGINKATAETAISTAMGKNNEQHKSN